MNHSTALQTVIGVFLLTSALQTTSVIRADELRRLKYNNPGLVVDLGVGLWAWPMPMDYDGDGDFDLVVSCPDKPYNGTYFFENPGGEKKLPVFKPGVRIGPGFRNIQVSHVGGRSRVLVPGREYADFTSKQFSSPVTLSIPANVHIAGHKIRANQWKHVDYDGDGDLDVSIGVGDWKDYGWDDAFDQQGRWTRGPLRGFVYIVRNTGTDAQPKYAMPKRIVIGGKPLEVFGWPTPNFADMDDDGDLDLICGEFVDKLTYFENVGSRTEPKYKSGRFLMHGGKPLRMDLQMIVPAAVDWDRDGDMDFVVGDEDGRVALIENTGKLIDSLPQFRLPKYFRQQADEVKFGALVTPFSFDWDGDGDEDLLCGNTAGYIGFIENLSGGPKPKWAAPRHLQADGTVIRIQAGNNGSIQGPCEAKWGYTTLCVADWNHDKLPDLVVNSIWGEVLWYENTGTRTKPRLRSAQRIDVEWLDAPPKPDWVWWKPKGKQLATQWRTTPMAVDFNGDGLNDLVMLDHEGYLALFERRRQNGKLQLLPGQRIFVDGTGKPMRLNAKRAGGSGRRKIHIVDWDGDGRLDVLLNSVNADLLQNKGVRAGKTILENVGLLDGRKLAGHTSSPTTVDWDKNGIPDLLVGAEDGYLYYVRNPRAR